jgi:hypothetical protein
MHSQDSIPPLPPGSQFTHLRLHNWGQTLTFTLVAADQTFQLRLLDCREARWQWYSHVQVTGEPAFPPSTIVTLRSGQDRHRKPLQVLTDFFALSVTYGQLQFIPQNPEIVV